MAEKNILAYFKSREEAEKAENQLKSVGVIDSQIKEVGLYPGEGINHRLNPISGDVPSLAYLTLGADISNRDNGILLSSNVSASGMSGPQDDMVQRNFLLTVVVDESKHHQALHIVENTGGMI